LCPIIIPRENPYIIGHETLSYRYQDLSEWSASLPGSSPIVCQRSSELENHGADRREAVKAEAMAIREGD